MSEGRACPPPLQTTRWVGGHLPLPGCKKISTDYVSGQCRPANAYNRALVCRQSLYRREQNYISLSKNPRLVHTPILSHFQSWSTPLTPPSGPGQRYVHAKSTCATSPIAIRTHHASIPIPLSPTTVSAGRVYPAVPPGEGITRRPSHVARSSLATSAPTQTAPSSVSPHGLVASHHQLTQKVQKVLYPGDLTHASSSPNSNRLTPSITGGVLVTHTEWAPPSHVAPMTKSDPVARKTRMRTCHSYGCSVVCLRSDGHEATDTGFAYAPVSKAHGHHHSVQCFALLHCSADHFCTTPGGF